jgi:hypothetical protein
MTFVFLSMIVDGERMTSLLVLIANDESSSVNDVRYKLTRQHVNKHTDGLLFVSLRNTLTPCQYRHRMESQMIVKSIQDKTN